MHISILLSSSKPQSLVPRNPIARPIERAGCWPSSDGGQERLFAATIGTTGFHRTGRRENNKQRRPGLLDLLSSWLANGAPGRARTSCLRFRKPPLCPDELREQSPRKTPGLARTQRGPVACAGLRSGLAQCSLQVRADLTVHADFKTMLPDRSRARGVSLLSRRSVRFIR